MRPSNQVGNLSVGGTGQKRPMVIWARVEILDDGKRVADSEPRFTEAANGNKRTKIELMKLRLAGARVSFWRGQKPLRRGHRARFGSSLSRYVFWRTVLASAARPRDLNILLMDASREPLCGGVLLPGWPAFGNPLRPFEPRKILIYFYSARNGVWKKRLEAIRESLIRMPGFAFPPLECLVPAVSAARSASSLVQRNSARVLFLH